MIYWAPICTLIYLRKITKQSSSNACLYLQNRIPFPVRRGRPKKSEILYEIWELFWQTWYGVDHKGLVYTVRWASDHPHISKEDYEKVKQQWQWMPLFASQHPISHTERVPGICYISWNLRVVFGRNDTVRTIRGLYMLSEAPLSILISLRKVVKYSSSSGFLAVYDSIPFSVLRGSPKSDISHEFWELFLAEKTRCGQ